VELEARSVCDRDGLRAVVNAEFGQDVLDGMESVRGVIRSSCGWASPLPVMKMFGFPNLAVSPAYWAIRPRTAEPFAVAVDRLDRVGIGVPPADERLVPNLLRKPSRESDCSRSAYCLLAQASEKDEEAQMKRLVATGSAIVALVLITAGSAFATDPHSGGSTGQPSQSCQAEPSTPGHAASAPGSAFNPDGNAGTHYAGTQPQNSKNPNSVAQYDVACFQVSQH
jgi:hypothetical protein